jgi:hypothetical protein
MSWRFSHSKRGSIRKASAKAAAVPPANKRSARRRLSAPKGPVAGKASFIGGMGKPYCESLMKS